MGKGTKAGVWLLLGALGLGGGYLVADGADILPGYFTFQAPLPKVAPFPTPSPLALSASSQPLFNSETDVDKARFARLTKAFLDDDGMQNAQVSFWVGDLKGVTIAQSHADTALTAASTTKVLTSVAALSQLGAESRLRTVVAWDNAARKLYLIGGGDVLLGEGPDEVGSTVGAAGLGSLAEDTVAALVDSNGKSLLAGKAFSLIYDTSWFGTQTENPTWPEGYAAHATPIQGLGIDAGKTAGADGTSAADPSAYAAQVFARQLGDVKLETKRLGKTSTLSGTQPANIQAGKSGLATTELLDPTRKLPTKSTDPALEKGPQVVAYSQGATLALVVRETLKPSDNTIAETLGRLVALHRGAKPTFAAAGTAVMDSLRELGIELGTSNLAGASGLSPQTHISAKALANVVITASSSKHPQLHAAVANLPVAGVDGTLARSYVGTLAAGNLRGKTGTLDGAHSLAGTFVYENQVLVYGLIIANYPSADYGATITAKQAFLTKLIDPQVTGEEENSSKGTASTKEKSKSKESSKDAE